MQYTAALLAFLGVASGYQLRSVPVRPASAHAVTRVQPPQMIDFDMNTVIGVGTLFGGLGGGVALIAFTENAGQ